MRRPATNKKRVPLATTYHPVHAQAPVMGDSLEVLEDYHREKVQVIESTLQQLNLLENAREIAFLCQEVSRVKETLKKIYQQKKFLA